MQKNKTIGLLNTNQFATTDVCILLSILKRICSNCFSLYAILKCFFFFVLPRTRVEMDGPLKRFFFAEITRMVCNICW